MNGVWSDQYGGMLDRRRFGRAIRRKENWGQLTLFCLIGGSGYLVNVALFAACVQAIGLAPYVAAVVAFAGAVCNNFLWNRRWTFPRRGPGARHEAIRFFVVSSIAFGVSLSMLTALVAVARLPAISAQVISIAVAMPVSFAGNKLWTFRQDSSRDSPGNSATPLPGPPQVISADKEVSI